MPNAEEEIRTPAPQMENRLSRANKNTDKINVSKKEFERYLNIRKINGITDLWLYDIRKYVTDFLNYSNWIIDEDLALTYFNKIRNKYSITSYRKQIYQIRKFLKYLGIEWVNNIMPPAEPQYIPKRITKVDIKSTLAYFKKNESYIKIKSLILLGASSGMRAHELYQLKLRDINVDDRIVNINHNPNNGQSTKTKMSRISFFNEEAKQTLREYLSRYDKNCQDDCLFAERYFQNSFEKAPIKVKDLRKFFSQEWDRSGGATSIKKILMGHSLKGDVDLMHYNCQSEEDLKKIYDKVLKIANGKYLSWRGLLVFVLYLIYQHHNQQVIMLQILQLNLSRCVTNVALSYLATFIIYNGVTIIINGR